MRVIHTPGIGRRAGRRRTGAGVLCAAASSGALVLTGLTVPAAAQEPTPSPNGIEIPAPTGQHETGTTLVKLSDRSRKDTLTGSATRDLMVQAWYPAKPGTGGDDAPYAPAGEVAALQQAFGFVPGAFEAKTNSALNATPAKGRYPLVLFNHGLCGARTDSTIVAEELASRGYIVVAVGTTGESVGVEFPDGRVVTTADPNFCLAGAAPFTTGKPTLERLSAVRVADARFVLDQMTRRGRSSSDQASGSKEPTADVFTQVRRGVDKRRIGMYGHSFGGGTTANVMLVDKRVDAGVNLDGFVVSPAAEKGLNRPFLVVGNSYHTSADDLSWVTFLPRLTGWHRWFQVREAGHYRFIDYGGSARKWGLDKTMKVQDPTTWEQIFGDIEDAESQRINRSLVVGMFDRFLKGRSAPVLKDPSSIHPLIKDRTDEIG